MKNKKTQKVLTGLLMGVNLVNSFAPMAGLLVREAPKSVAKAKTEDTQIEYTPVSYQSLMDSVDRAVFSTAEAAFTPDVNGSSVSKETVTISGDVSVQKVHNGGTATDGIISKGGVQNVYSGGTASGGIISSGGVQNISTGGTASGGIISGGGTQNVSNGGTADVNTMSGGVQNIYSGGTASVGIISSGAGKRIFLMVAQALLAPLITAMPLRIFL